MTVQVRRTPVLRGESVLTPARRRRRYPKNYRREAFQILYETLKPRIGLDIELVNGDTEGKSPWVVIRKRSGFSMLNLTFAALFAIERLRALGFQVSATRV